MIMMVMGPLLPIDYNDNDGIGERDCRDAGKHYAEAAIYNTDKDV